MHAKIDTFLATLPFINVPKEKKSSSPKSPPPVQSKSRGGGGMDAFAECDEEDEDEDEDESGGGGSKKVEEEEPEDSNSDSDSEDDEHGGLGMLSSVCKYEAFKENEPIFCEGELGDKVRSEAKRRAEMAGVQDVDVRRR